MQISGGLERLKDKHFPATDVVRQKDESTLERVRQGEGRLTGGPMKDRTSQAPTEDAGGGTQTLT